MGSVDARRPDQPSASLDPRLRSQRHSGRSRRRHRGVRARRRQTRRDKRPVRRRLCRVRAGRGRQIASKPAALDYIRAAGLPVVAVTAWQMLFEHARIELGQAVLVRCAAGSVGACATQMAMEARASLASLGPRAPGTSNACSAASAIRAVVDGERLGTIRPAQLAARHHGLHYLRPRGRMCVERR